MQFYHRFYDLLSQTQKQVLQQNCSKIVLGSVQTCSIFSLTELHRAALKERSLHRAALSSHLYVILSDSRFPTYV